MLDRGVYMLTSLRADCRCSLVILDGQLLRCERTRGDGQLLHDLALGTVDAPHPVSLHVSHYLRSSFPASSSGSLAIRGRVGG